MSTTSEPIEDHYQIPDLLNVILDVLRSIGKDITKLTPIDLAPVDEFHTRGREATIELATLAQLRSKLHILDVGCGIGGSARYLASEYDSIVAGIDLTQEYIRVATALGKLVGLEQTVSFHHGTALALPFDDQSFDVVWTEHAQMNISNKIKLYEEMARVLRTNGQLVLHDVFQGPGGDIEYPVPWAKHPSISFLATPEVIQQTLTQVGFEIIHWVDKTSTALRWIDETAKKIQTPNATPLGVHLLMGTTAPQKLMNQVQNLKNNRVVVCQAVLRKK